MTYAHTKDCGRISRIIHSIMCVSGFGWTLSALQTSPGVACPHAWEDIQLADSDVNLHSPGTVAFHRMCRRFQVKSNHPKAPVCLCSLPPKVFPSHKSQYLYWQQCKRFLLEMIFISCSSQLACCVPVCGTKLHAFLGGILTGTGGFVQLSRQTPSLFPSARRFILISYCHCLDMHWRTKFAYNVTTFRLFYFADSDLVSAAGNVNTNSCTAQGTVLINCAWRFICSVCRRQCVKIVVWKLWDSSNTHENDNLLCCWFGHMIDAGTRKEEPE